MTHICPKCKQGDLIGLHCPHCDDFPQEPNAEIKTESLDSIKITKNSKGYNYEIKTYREKDEPMVSWMRRIIEIEEKLKEKYGEDGRRAL